MNIYLDIETLPTNDCTVIAELAATITAPGQYKKPESIKEWLAENLEESTKALVAKTSFDGLYGRIACIAWAFDDGEIVSTNKDHTEQQAITALYEAVSAYTEIAYQGGKSSSAITVVGHNVAGFDLPFLKHRSIILGIKPEPSLRRAMNAKPWDESISDTMLMWSTDRDKRVSMNKLCRAFGIADKDGFDGSMVADTWPVDPQKVIDYCRDDVKRTREIYKRMMFI
jgi:3'-5' exonuclease